MQVYQWVRKRGKVKVVSMKCHLCLQNLHFVVDVDIVGFFDNIDHSKLIRQLWGIGIQDRKLIMIIKQMLKAEILFNDITITPETGTPQGGFYPHFLQMLY